MRPFVIFLGLVALSLISLPGGQAGQTGRLFAESAVVTVTVDNPVLPPLPPPGGGGGTRPPARAIFSGTAFPFGTISLLKDGQLVVAGRAGAAANFSLTLEELSGGSYLFALYGVDQSGRQSSLLTLPLAVSAGSITNVSGIFLSPTLSLESSPVGREFLVSLAGQSAPRAAIEIFLTGPAGQIRPPKTSADNFGNWSYFFAGRGMSPGDYSVQARASQPPLVSAMSLLKRFVISPDKEFKEPEACPPVADLNGDCRVNLIDFSVVVFWFEKAGAPPAVDLNGDGKIDLVDLSIAAYWWTG